MKYICWIIPLMTGVFVQQALTENCKDSLTNKTIKIDYKVTVLEGCAALSQPIQGIPECVREGADIIKINHVASFSFNDPTPGSFLQANTSGGAVTIKLIKTIDSESTDGRVNFPVTCDGGRYNLILIMENTIEGRYTFNQETYTVNVTENTAIGTVLIPDIEVDFSDVPVDYLINITQPGFEMGYKSPSGNVYKFDLLLARNLTYDQKQPQYKFTITIYDANHRDRNGTAQFIVYVNDSDNLPPKFDQKIYGFNVSEDKTVNTRIGSVKAHDQDFGIDETINYELVHEIPDLPVHLFAVNRDTGEVTVAHPLDRENCSKVILMIKGYQVDKPTTRIDHTYVEISILDVNDNTPKFEKPKYDVDVLENIPKGTIILPLIATDEDEHTEKVLNDVLRYSIVNGNSRFMINSSSGVLSLKETLDYESNQKYNIVVQVSDGSKSSTATVNINVRDVNDNNPVFNASPYNFNITKTYAVNGEIGKVLAEDKDSSAITTIRYTMKDPTFNAFAVDQTSGNVTLKVNLTENFNPLFTFEVVAMDGDSTDPSHREGSVIVNVHVADVNVHTPKFEKPNYSVDVLENEAVHTTLLYLKATDKDPTDVLTYRIMSGDSTRNFFLNSSSGMLSLSKLLDHETNPKHTITVEVSDSIHTSTAVVDINVVDVNDNKPTFSNPSYRYNNITEGAISTVGYVVAIDKDQGNNSVISFSIESPWSSNFSIDNTGKIQLKSELDRETIDNENGEIRFVVLATDHGQPSLTGSTQVIVEVKDINDNCPYFNTQDLKFTYIFDELSVPKDFHQIQAQDLDRTPANRKMRHSIGGSPGGFTIDQPSGNLSASQPLKMENTANGQITLTITVSNNPNCQPASTATQTVVIMVKDVNRFAPKFSNTPYVFSIKESLSDGSSVTNNRIIALDQDTSPHYNTVTYWVSGGDPDGHFYMDSKTAEILLVKPLDYENKTQYTLTIHATDGHELHDGSYTNATATVTINVEDVNDNSPEFKQAIYRCVFLENQKQTRGGCHVQATDKDASTSIKYSLNTTTFEIDPHGKISVTSANGVDFDEGTHLYIIKVTAFDGNRTGTTIAEIRIENVNDNTPEFNVKYTFSVMEDAPANTILGIVSAVDKDGDDLTYSMTSSDFEIHPDGVLLTKASLRDKTHLVFNVSAYDSAKVGSTSVTVNVIDVNNHPPVFAQPRYEQNVTENQSNVFVVKVVATDADHSPSNKNISYELIESEWSHNFSIDQSGTIRVNGALDREVLGKSDDIKLVVMATDRGDPPLSGTSEVTVHVIDVNDHCPYYKEEYKDVTFVFKEYEKPTHFHDCWVNDDDVTDSNKANGFSYNGTEIGILINVDQSGKHVNHVWFNASKPFRLNQNGVGEINIVHVKFIGSDCPGPQKTADQYVKIIIQDVNDHSPVFNRTTYTFSVKEDAEPGDKVNDQRIQASDGDPTEEFNTVHYSILSGDTGRHFHIDELTGDISIVNQLDYETQKTYSLKIGATDGRPFYTETSRPARTSTATVQISVKDVNDNRPTFLKDLYQCSVNENYTGPISDCLLGVHDNDTGTNGQYTIKSLNQHFTVDDTGHIDVSTPLDYESGTTEYTVIIQAIDKGTPPLTGTTIVIIKVNDTNDNPPQLDGPLSFTLSENQPLHTIVGVVRAKDVDTESKLAYRLINGTADFEINKDDGTITSLKSFDYERDHNMDIRVQVSDGKHSVSTTVHVTIGNLNDNQPQFTNRTYYIDVEETVDKRIFPVVTTASDKDNLGSLSYDIIGGDTGCHDIFSINSSTGALSINNAGHCLDYDKSPVHTLLIQAKDEKMADSQVWHSSQAMIQINVLDEDTKPPKFVWSTYKASVKENEHAGTNVVRVKATDPDTAADKLTYKVVNSTTEFKFLGNELQTNTKLDAETQEVYFVNISVSDPGGRADFSVVEIHVRDVNDNSPTFIPAGVKSFQIPANAQGNRSVGIIQAKDNDITNTGVSYFLPHTDHFWINSESGKIYVMDGRGTDQFEANVTYKVVVMVMDHGQPPRSAQTEIDVFIDITNHYPPKFSDLPDKNIILKENSGRSTHVAQVHATDSDPGDAGLVYYKLVPKPAYNGIFTLNETSGEVTLIGSINYEKTSYYELEVLAIDKADDPKTSTTHVQIIIQDVNEKPSFVEKMDGLCIRTPILKDSLVGVVNAQDPDKNDVLHYSLTDSSNFIIDETTGRITAKKNLSGQNYEITVIVIDKGNLTAMKNISLNNNPSLVITPAIILVNVTENSTNHYITTVQGQSSNSLNYSLYNSPGFTINSTGAINSDGPLDREKKSKEEVYVKVTSNASTCQAQVTINVIDINDNPPRFGFQYDVPRNIPEDFPNGTCFFNLPVEDPDLNTILNFTITKDNSGGKFTIQRFSNQTGGCLMLRSSLDYDTMATDLHGTYLLTAEVSDGKYSSSREIRVHIDDVNDNSPKFNKTMYYAETYEGLSPSTSILFLEAYDNDAVDEGKLTYSLEGGDSTYFSIRHGDLEVDCVLDRENRSSYIVTVVAIDTAGHKGTTQVNITVLDVNDNAPKFTQSSYSFSHEEGKTSKGFQMRLTTTDPDLGENGTNTFKLMNTNYRGLFNISTLPNNIGVITVLTELDRESPSVQKENGTAVYILHIDAIDNGRPQKTASTVVTLDITDINDCIPEFTKSSYNATVLEGSPKGFSILTVTTSDCDYEPEFTDVSFSLEGNDTDLFQISKNGEIRLQEKVSVKSHKDNYNFMIVANDSLNVNKVPLHIHITDVNDHDPVFTETIYNFSVPETKGISYVVGVVSARDDDLGANGNVTYSIISADVRQLFNISQNGTIATIGALDRDECINNRYPFTVVAVDGGESSRTGYTEVVVYITDINDNSPKFSHTSYSGTVKENSPDNSGVLILPPIVATDPDEGINGTEGINYSLIGSDLMFWINAWTGEVFTNTSNLDRETTPGYHLQVQAADRNGTGLTTIVNLTITLIDVNDEPPVFTENNYTFSISESAISGQKVGVVTTTDDDIHGNLTNRYRISSGADGKFYVDILSGEIYTTGNLDREDKPEYDLMLEAFDGQQKTNTTVHIYLLDSNDNCPVFQGDRLIQVPEDVSNGTVVYNLTATDKDSGENGRVTFFMNESDPFILRDSSLVIDGSLDRETKSLYTLVVYALDHGSPPCTSNTTFGMAIQDVNDNSPIFYNPDGQVIDRYEAIIIEKSPCGTPIFLPSVKDIDSGKNSEIEFSLEAPSLGTYFGIDPRTGVVNITAQIDLNSLNRLHILSENATQTAKLELVVKARDKGSPPNQSSLNLTVLVEGINDQAPVFLRPVYEVTIAENIPDNSYIATVEATVQNGTHYRLTYSLISDSIKYFSVAPVSGNITTKSIIDREVTPHFDFAVQVTDGKIPERTAYTLVKITVTDENDNHPEFEEHSYEYIVEENVVPPGVQILATDKDSGQNGNVSYRLLNNPGNQFILGESIGLLTVNGTLDREEHSVYTLTIEAFDHGNPAQTSTVQVVVTVLDQNDNQPNFGSSIISCNITENKPAGTPVCSISATDPDNSLNGSVVYMFASGSSYSQFDIDPLDGSIKTLESLDYEKQAEHHLTIMATDLGTPALNSTLDLIIYVKDVYDTAPNFPQNLYEISVDIDTNPGMILTMVSAGKYPAVYKIEDGNNGNQFQINSSSGAITLSSSLGTTVLEYHLKISASDGNTTDYTTVLVHVTTSNVQQSKTTYNVSIPENTNGTHLLTKLNYTDGSNAVFKYQIHMVIPPDNNTFLINETTGEIFSVHQLDREKIDQYTIRVRAILASTRKRRSFGDSPQDITVVVKVTDVNDNHPTFGGYQDMITVGVPDTTGVGDLVTTITAVDQDLDSKIKYSISGGKDQDKFSVGVDSGKIYSKIKVKQGRGYMVILTANDGLFTTNVTVKLMVISDSDKVVMTIPIPTSEFEAKNKTILRNISTIVGFHVEMEKYGVHVDSNTHSVDLSKTDIYFHGINETGGSVLPQEEAVSIVTSKTKEINSLFYPQNVTIIRYRTPLPPPQRMSVAEIALLVIGVFIFVATLVAIIVAHYTWKQFKSSQKTLQDKMWELNSIHSSQMNGTVRQNEVGVVNPAFTETTLTTAANNISSADVRKKDDADSERRRQEYESQEVILDLPLEPLEAVVPPPANGAREMSLGYDSGLENESDSTGSGGENGANGLTDSQEAEAEGEGAAGMETPPKEIHISTNVAVPSTEHDVFTFEMETGDTDDSLDDADLTDGKISSRRKSSKKKKSELKVYFPQADEDTDDENETSSKKHLSTDKIKTDNEDKSGSDEKNLADDSESIVNDTKNAEDDKVDDEHSDQELEITSF